MNRPEPPASNRDALVFALEAYVLTLSVLLYSRPRAVFHADGSARDFGLGAQRTLAPFGLLLTLSALVAYSFFVNL